MKEPVKLLPCFWCKGEEFKITTGGVNISKNREDQGYFGARATIKCKKCKSTMNQISPTILSKDWHRANNLAADAVVVDWNSKLTGVNK